MQTISNIKPATDWSFVISQTDTRFTAYFPGCCVTFIDPASGKMKVTSPVVHYDQDDRLVVTKKSFYRLGAMNEAYKAWDRVN